MTDVRADLFDIAGFRADGKAMLTSTVVRPSNVGAGTVVPVTHLFEIRNGVLRMDGLDPGPAVLRISMGRWSQEWHIGIPDSSEPVGFETILDQYQEYEPGVVSEVRTLADRAGDDARRAELAADRAEGAADHVDSVVADGAAAVRGEFQADRDAAVAASVAAAGSAVSAAGERAAAEAAAVEAVAAKGVAETAGADAVAAKTDADAAKADAVAARVAAETARADAVAAKSSAQSAASTAAAQVVSSLTSATAADRNAAQNARIAAEAATVLAVDSAEAAEGFADAAEGFASAADAARIAAEAAAENANQGAPSGGWLWEHLAPDVQDALDHAANALTEVPAATSSALGGVRMAGVLAGSATAPGLAGGAVGSVHIADEAVLLQHLEPALMGGAYLSALLFDASFDDGDYVGLPGTFMSESVQTTLGKADTAYQKPSAGVPKTDLASDVQASVNKADTAYQKPQAGIPTADLAGGITKAKLATDVQASLGKADTAVQTHDGRAVKHWYGTQAEYDALPTATKNAAGFTVVIL